VSEVQGLGASSCIVLVIHPQPSPPCFRDLRITAIRDLTVTAAAPGGWDSEQPSGLPALPVSRGSEMITFKLSNNAVATLRGSGTEPKLKVYCELRGSDAGTARAEADRTARLILDEMLQPEKHGLRRPAGM
jgi:phosphoglucomutase